MHGDIADDYLDGGSVRDTDPMAHFAAETHNDDSHCDSWPFMHTDVVGATTLVNAIREQDVQYQHI